MRGRREEARGCDGGGGSAVGLPTPPPLSLYSSGSVSAASLLNVEEAKDKSGKTYYKYEILTRTADGNEGGRHHLIAAAAAANGVLYICHTTIGDKRWFKGEDKSAVRRGGGGGWREAKRVSCGS